MKKLNNKIKKQIEKDVNEHKLLINGNNEKCLEKLREEPLKEIILKDLLSSRFSNEFMND